MIVTQLRSDILSISKADMNSSITARCFKEHTLHIVRITAATVRLFTVTIKYLKR